MYIALKNRALLKVSGPDAKDFLQGLISQDITRVTDAQAVYSAFLSPQGKFLFDFFCFEMDGSLVLDCEDSRRSDFYKRLSMYKLRSDVEITDISADFCVYGVLTASKAFGLQDEARGVAKPFGTGVAFTDPRLRTMGCRVVLEKEDKALPNAGLSLGDFDDYEQRRFSHGLADGSRDMSVNKALLLENGFEELDGVCFTKGCFMGQELTARTRYRGLVKKRLLPVTIQGPAPKSGSILMDGEFEAGEMKSSQGDQGLALIRLDRLSPDAVFHFGTTSLTPSIPDWVVFQTKDEG